MLPDRSGRSVVIVGAGIHGLSMAWALATSSAWKSIRIYSREAPEHTTSSVAGGLVEPGFQVGPDRRGAAWFAASRAIFAQRVAEPRWSVRRAAVRSLWRTPTPPPSWASAVDNFTVLPIVAPPYTQAWRYESYVVEVPRHLAEMARRLRDLGIDIVYREVTSLDALRDDADLIINCSGAGAKALGDSSVTPGSGQVVILERDARIPDEVILDDEPLTYVIPRLTDVVVGGTLMPGETSRVPHLEVAEALLARACRLVPQLAHARVLAHRVGLRPLRPQPRLEIESSTGSGARIAHCYGTGGAGISLAPGMAQDLAARLVTIFN